MNKEQQIEEIRNIIETDCDFVCNKCEFDGKEHCFIHYCSNALYNAGYRKQSEGEWISNRQTGEYICNLCGGIAPVDCEKEDFYKSNYCPHCGAKMKGGEQG